MATLHNHAEALDLPLEIRPKRWDRVFYYPDEPIVYDNREYNHLFTPRRVAVMERVIEMASSLLDRLYADTASVMLIHGDMHFWNVNVYRDKLYLFDFEDTMLGYPLQDVAITLSYGRDREIYPELRASFETGYRSVRRWPVDSWADVETLIAARSVNFINYVARIEPDPAEYVSERCARLERFLDQYG
jgi:Ser/Thr protein kinase RdoA (MazF antagonist)